MFAGALLYGKLRQFGLESLSGEATLAVRLPDREAREGGC